jgi:hypothetical protein
VLQHAQGARCDERAAPQRVAAPGAPPRARRLEHPRLRVPGHAGEDGRSRATVLAPVDRSARHGEVAGIRGGQRARPAPARLEEHSVARREHDQIAGGGDAKGRHRGLEGEVEEVDRAPRAQVDDVQVRRRPALAVADVIGGEEAAAAERVRRRVARPRPGGRAALADEQGAPRAAQARDVVHARLVRGRPRRAEDPQASLGEDGRPAAAARRRRGVAGRDGHPQRHRDQPRAPHAPLLPHLVGTAQALL